MGVTLVTGASGFIGSHVARALAARGDRVRATRRASSNIAHLQDVPLDWATADMLDRRAVRRALRGVDRVFHVAGTTDLRLSSAEMFRINVDATRIVLEEALRAEVARVVYTSSVAAIGPAPVGGATDETQLFTAGHLGIPYVNAKHEAEVEALRLAAHGLPLVIVNPSHVLGPGDYGHSSTALVRRFMLRRIPAAVEGALNVVDVRDVAAGHLAADEHGTVGERYILGDRNYTWNRLFADLSRLSGVQPPAIGIPARAVEPLLALLAVLPLTPPVSPMEIRAAAQWWCYRNTKARRELGWTPRIPHEDTVEATVRWYQEREGGRIARVGRRQPLQLRLLGTLVRQAERLPL